MADPFVMRPATAEDAVWFATRLRATDLAEVFASYADPEDGLRRAIAGSEICVVGEINGIPAVILGAAENADGDVGIPWLLGTDELRFFPGALTKLGRRYVAIFKERWPVLLNYVDARNTTSVRWLKRLGFEIKPPIKFGRNGEWFHPFLARA